MGFIGEARELTIMVAELSKLESIVVDEAWAATEDGMIDEAPEAETEDAKEEGVISIKSTLRDMSGASGLTASTKRLLEGDSRSLVSDRAVGDDALGRGRLESGGRANAGRVSAKKKGKRSQGR